MYIDTHCHLNFKAFNDDYNDVYEQAYRSGIEKIIVVGTSLASSKRAIELTQELEGCFATVGVHPHHSKEFQEHGSDAIHEQLARLLGNKKVVAVGETGIDYYTYKGYPPIADKEKKDQHELLELHIDLAQTFHLPLILHCREAMDDMLEFFKHKKGLRGVFHCFSGTVDQLKNILEMGFYVGFDGNSTYKANQYLRDAIAVAPLDRILIETDSPYLTPEPHRGGRNVPSYVTLVAECVSSVKRVPLEAIKEQTATNAKRLFKL